MTTKLSVVAIQSLKEALCTIYWYKSDLKFFFDNCINDKRIISEVNWGNYKRQFVSDIIDILCEDQQKYLGELRRLLNEVCQMDNFRHLEKLDDGKRKAQKAKEAVKALKLLVGNHDEKVRNEEEIIKKKRNTYERLNANKEVSKKLEDINIRYTKLISSTKPQERGYELEKVMYELFSLFDLDPRASFKNIGEQIDGAFSLEGLDYIFEAKWQSRFMDISDLDAFSGKIHRKLDNTLGLFLSINGISEDAVRIHSSGRSTMLLMDGADLMAVLDGRIDFVSMLIRKRRHAAQTGKIYMRINEIL